MWLVVACKAFLCLLFPLKNLGFVPQAGIEPARTFLSKGF